MAVAEVEVPPLQHVWSQAVEEYTTQLRKAGQPVDLEMWKDVQDIDDLVARLEVEHGVFDKDVGRGSKFTSALKTGFAPVTLLMNTLGGPASAAFAPCSQIFGAVTVLINAAKNTGAAFDDIAGLFNDLGRSTQLIKPLTKRRPPPQLESIIQGILVCLLTVCALATKRTCHVPDKAKHRSVKQVFSGVKSNVAEFGRQLLFGDDAEIVAAKSNLRYLSESQAQLVGVLTLEKVGDLQEDMTRIGAVAVDVKDNTARMESVVVHIKGLSLEISSAMVELQTDVAGVKIRLEEVGAVVSRIDFKIDDIRDNMLTKADQKESLVMFNERFDRLEMLAKGTPTNVKAAKPELSKTAVMHSKRLQQLKARLKPESANRSFYTRIAESELIPGTGDWILQRPELLNWLEGNQPVLCLSGDTGCGKTFLAARIVKHIQATYPQGIQCPSAISLGFFFAKSELKELRSIRNLLCTAAFQVSQNDRVYAGHIDVNTKGLDLTECSIETLWQTLFVEFFANARGSTFLVMDAIDECDMDEIEEFVEALKSTNFEQSDRVPSNLRILLVHNSALRESLESTIGSVASFFHLDPSYMKGDIVQAVDKKMNDAWSGKLVSNMLYNEVRDAILSASQMNFLWCCLVVEDLTVISREDVVRAHLKHLPCDVNAAMLLLLSRLSRRLDEFGIEDLNDLLAWVECSHRFQSLSTLDAILTLRKPGGARIIDLDSLIKQDFSGLFISTTDENSSVWPSEQRIQQRLQDRQNVADDIMSVVDAATIDRTEAGGEPYPQATETLTATKEDSPFERKIEAWSKVTVRLTHRLVKQYIEERTVRDDLRLTTHHMHATVLIGCLRNICEPDPTQDQDLIDRANSYCAVYLPEHLSDVDPSTVDEETVRVIVSYLPRLLRHEPIIYQWITYAAEHMAEDLLQKTEFRDSILSWFKAASNLSDEEQSWISEVFEAPVAVLFNPLARCLTLRWLDTDEDEMSDCVMFIIQWLEEAKELRPSLQANEIERETYGLEGRALQVLQAARWIKHDESAHFFQRIGDVLRDEEFDLPDEAIRMYLRGIELDANVARLHAGLAMAYEMPSTDEGHKLAIPHMIKAVELSSTQLGVEDLTNDARVSLNDLLQLCTLRLCLYYKWTNEIDKCNSTFERLLDNWEGIRPDDWGSRSQLGAYFWFETLQERSDFVAAAGMLKRIVEHPLRQNLRFRSIYTLFLSEPNLLLQVAYETKTFGHLDQFWVNGIQVLARYGDDGEVSAARFYRSLAILRLCPTRTDEAVLELNRIISDVEIARPTNEWHWVKERAERELSRVYFQRALEARDEDRWHQVGVNIDELVRLCRINPDSDQAEIVNRECASILAAWNRLNGQRLRAMQCARPKLEHGINVLTDSDPTNDLEAWQCFGDACLAVGDIERAVTAVGMQKQLCRFGASVIEGVTEDVPSETGDIESRVEAGDNAVTTEEDPAAKTRNPGEDSGDKDTTNDEGSASSGHERDEAFAQQQAHVLIAGPEQSEIDSRGPFANTESNTDPIDVAGADEASSEEDEEEEEEEEKEEKDNDDSQNNGKDNNEENLAYTCDGPCFGTIPNQDVFYRCSYCIADFCEPCHDSITSDRMESFSVCSKLHERHLMPALGDKFELGCLEVNGISFHITDWLRDLKQAWNLLLA